MKTKSGLSIPAALTELLQKRKSLKNAWDKLRPGCQRDYVERIRKAKKENNLENKLKRVITLTMNYAKMHPHKHQRSAHR